MLRLRHVQGDANATQTSLLALAGLGGTSPFQLLGDVTVLPGGGWDVVKHVYSPALLRVTNVPSESSDATVVVSTTAAAAVACSSVVAAVGGASTRVPIDVSCAVVAHGAAVASACVGASSLVCPLTAGAGAGAGVWAFLTDTPSGGAVATGGTAAAAAVGGTKAVSLPELHPLCPKTTLLHSLLRWLHALCATPSTTTHSCAAVVLQCLQQCRLPPVPLAPYANALMEVRL